MRITYADSKEYEDCENEMEVEENEVKEQEDDINWFDPLDFEQQTPERLPIKGGWITRNSGEGLVEMPENHSTKVVEAGDIIEIITSSNKANGSSFKHIKNLPGNRYLNLKTGEIKGKKRNKNRTDSIANLNQSIREIAWLIRINFYNEKGYFITLAYDYHMDDYYTAQQDFNKFLDKLKYYYKSRFGLKLSYLKVIEPKSSGSWHFHVLLKTQNGAPLEISEAFVREKWGHHSVKVEPIKSAEGLAAYLGRPTVTRNYQEEDLGMTVLNEKYSYDRRGFYKSGMHLYSKSRDLEKPTSQEMSDEEARALVADYERISKNYKIVKSSWREEAHILNIINYETFKKK